MGWREFTGYVTVMNAQIEGQKPDPHSWAGTDQDAGWVELRRKRDEMRGR